MLLAKGAEKIVDGDIPGLNPNNVGGPFSSKKEITLKEITFSVEETLNNNCAVRVHLVLVYKKELEDKLSSMDSRQYFESFEQIIKDNPDKIKILEWQICAERRMFSWKKKDESAFAPPKKAFIFVSYSNMNGSANSNNNNNVTHGGKEHRAVIPVNCEKIKIMLEKEDFKLERVKEENN